jgi:hypothetical protein
MKVADGMSEQVLMVCPARRRRLGSPTCPAWRPQRAAASSALTANLHDEVLAS